MTIPDIIKALEECEQLLLTIQEALRRLATEAISTTTRPAWRKSSNHYEEPCIGSAFEKTGRRFTALYMGGYFIDLDELYDKLPKEDAV